jgi:hypothetical protein
MHFCPHLCTYEKTSQSVTHPKIAPGQARLTPEFFTGGLPKKKLYLGGMNILSLILSLEPRCHSCSTRKPFEVPTMGVALIPIESCLEGGE